MRLSFQHIIGVVIGGAVSGLFFNALGIHDSKQQAALKAAQAATQTIRNRAGIMKQSTIWTALLCVLSLAGCKISASNCAGWQKISVKRETAVYLAGNDQSAGKGVAGHNAYGKKAGCW